MATAVGRRDVIRAAAAAVAWPALAASGAPAPAARRARIAITLDLEMSRNFPRREDLHWDYEKGNLDEGTKAYAVAAARRVAD